MITEKVKELYKDEASSAIDLMRNVARKINEVIDEVNEFQSLRDNKYQEQDGKINKAIIYMKNNLKNTILDLFKVMKLNGELSEVVADSLFEEFDIIKKTTENIVRPESFGALGNRNC